MRIIEVIESSKKKGLDGKACWTGYKLAGTKMKGGRRVDNCVSMEETYEGNEFFEAYGELWTNEMVSYMKQSTKVAKYHSANRCEVMLRSLKCM